MTELTKQCIECGGQTHPINMIDRGYKNAQYQLTYADETPKNTALTRLFGHKNQAAVDAELCENCGRITLRAAPAK